MLRHEKSPFITLHELKVNESTTECSSTFISLDLNMVSFQADSFLHLPCSECRWYPLRGLFRC